LPAAAVVTVRLAESRVLGVLMIEVIRSGSNWTVGGAVS